MFSAAKLVVIRQASPRRRRSEPGVHTGADGQAAAIVSTAIQCWRRSRHDHRNQRDLEKRGCREGHHGHHAVLDRWPGDRPDCRSSIDALPPGGGPSADDAAAGQFDHTVGDAGDLPVVSDDQDRASRSACGTEDLEDLYAGPEVEFARRLVGEQGRVAGGQRPGDRHPLLLTTGELMREVAQAAPGGPPTPAPSAACPWRDRCARPRRRRTARSRGAVRPGNRLKLWNTKLTEVRRDGAAPCGSRQSDHARQADPAARCGCRGRRSGSAASSCRCPRDRGSPRTTSRPHAGRCRPERGHIHVADPVALGDAVDVDPRPSCPGCSLMATGGAALTSHAVLVTLRSSVLGPGAARAIRPVDSGPQDMSRHSSAAVLGRRNCGSGPRPWTSGRYDRSP